MIDFLSLFEGIHLGIFFKIPLLILLFIYSIVTFILFTRVRALNRIVYIRPAHASFLMAIFSFLYFMSTIVLFVIALVIL